jgi:hypothetical protein
MLYKRFLKLKKDTQIITDLETTHRYLRLLKSTSTLHAKVLQRVFAKFGNSYTLLDVATLALGSQPRQKLAKVRAKREARESYLMFLGV